MKILVINGPNLNMLGVREPALYGNRTYADLVWFIEASARDAGVEVEVFQSNHEGALVDRIQAARGAFDALVVSAAALATFAGLGFGSYSRAIRYLAARAANPKR